MLQINFNSINENTFILFSDYDTCSSYQSSNIDMHKIEHEHTTISPVNKNIW